MMENKKREAEKRWRAEKAAEKEAKRLAEREARDRADKEFEEAAERAWEETSEEAAERAWEETAAEEAAEKRFTTKDLPLWLKQCETALYDELCYDNDEDDDISNIPPSKLMYDISINSFEDLLYVYECMQYWCVKHFPMEVITYMFHVDIKYFRDKMEKYCEPLFVDEEKKIMFFFDALIFMYECLNDKCIGGGKKELSLISDRNFMEMYYMSKANVIKSFIKNDMLDQILKIGDFNATIIPTYWEHIFSYRAYSILDYINDRGYQFSRNIWIIRPETMTAFDEEREAKFAQSLVTYIKRTRNLDRNCPIENFDHFHVDLIEYLTDYLTTDEQWKPSIKDWVNTIKRGNIGVANWIWYFKISDAEKRFHESTIKHVIFVQPISVRKRIIHPIEVAEFIKKVSFLFRDFADEKILSPNVYREIKERYGIESLLLPLEEKLTCARYFSEYFCRYALFETEMIDALDFFIELAHDHFFLTDSRKEIEPHLILLFDWLMRNKCGKPHFTHIYREIGQPYISPKGKKELLERAKSAVCKEFEYTILSLN